MLRLRASYTFGEHHRHPALQSGGSSPVGSLRRVSLPPAERVTIEREGVTRTFEIRKGQVSALTVEHSPS